MDETPAAPSPASPAAPTSSESPPAPGTDHADAEDSTVEAAAAVDADVEPPGEPAAAASEAKPVARAPERGRLSVAVFPWGDVWIDGKARGKAPVRNVALPPGRHRVSAGQGKPWKTRIVRIKEGQRQSVQFDLSDYAKAAGGSASPK